MKVVKQPKNTPVSDGLLIVRIPSDPQNEPHLNIWPYFSTQNKNFVIDLKIYRRGHFRQNSGRPSNRESRDSKTNKLITRTLAGRTRLQILPDKSGASVDQFANDCIAPGAVVCSDGGTEFANLRNLGFDHRPVSMRGDREKMDSYLPMISRVTANLKTWIDGIFHGVGKPHLQTYLNEFMFRFNRRFFRGVSFRTLLGLGTHQPGVTYQEIYDVARTEKEEQK